MKKIKQFISSNKKVITGALAVSTSFASFNSHAALPEVAQAAVDQVMLLTNDFVDIAWQLAVIVLVASIGIKMLRKWVSTAT